MRRTALFQLTRRLERQGVLSADDVAAIVDEADADDQALSVVRSLLEKYPEVDARVIIGTCSKSLVQNAC